LQDIRPYSQHNKSIYPLLDFLKWSFDFFYNRVLKVMIWLLPQSELLSVHCQHLIPNDDNIICTVLRIALCLCPAYSHSSSIDCWSPHSPKAYISYFIIWIQNELEVSPRHMHIMGDTVVGQMTTYVNGVLLCLQQVMFWHLQPYFIFL